MSNQLKQIRGQVRQIVQEMLSGVLTTELVSDIQRTLTATQTAFHESQFKLLNDRLDRIENECRVALKKQDERAKAVQGFLVQGSMQEVHQFIRNAHVTMLAWQEIMVDRIGDKAEFEKQIDERKKAVAERLQAEAEEKMSERIKAEKATTESTESPEAPSETAEVDSA